MDALSGRRRPKHSRSSAWPVSGRLSPALCGTSAPPPGTASSTYSPVKTHVDINDVEVTVERKRN